MVEGGTDNEFEIGAKTLGKKLPCGDRGSYPTV